MTPLEIQRARKRLKLTQAELAAKLGVTPGAVAHWEQGLRQIQRPTVLLLHALISAQNGRKNRA